MAGVYTEETLSALNNQIIDLFLKIQEQSDTTIALLTAEIKRLNENFQKLRIRCFCYKKCEQYFV